MWTNENRSRYDRGKLRYPSDLTDAEWALAEPLIPPAKRRGNKRTVNRARGRRRSDVCPEHRLPVAGRSQGPAAAFDGLSPVVKPFPVLLWKGISGTIYELEHHAIGVNFNQVGSLYLLSVGVRQPLVCGLCRRDG